MALSASRLNKLRRLAEGKCSCCGKLEIYAGERCKDCYVKLAIKMRDKYRAKKETAALRSSMYPDPLNTYIRPEKPAKAKGGRPPGRKNSKPMYDPRNPESKRLCDCGNEAVEKKSGDWVCARCANLEATRTEY